MKKIIWALFQSETKFPEFDGYETYSFGMGGGTDHIHMDLSTLDCIKELEKYPKPDIIFASPPCESWVTLSCGHLGKYKVKKGLSLHWEKKWTPFDFEPRFKETRLNGVNTALTTAAIIQYFNPDLWCIENGNSSKLFDYIADHVKLLGFKNKCNYYSYGFDVLKPTIIYSNYKLNLHRFSPNEKMGSFLQNSPSSLRKIAAKKGQRAKKIVIDNYALSSKVPPDLYRHILRQFELGGQPTLFPLEETA